MAKTYKAKSILYQNFTIYSIVKNIHFLLTTLQYKDASVVTTVPDIHNMQQTMELIWLTRLA